MERDRIAAGGAIDHADTMNPITAHFNELHSRSEYVEEAILVLGLATVVLMAWAESTRREDSNDRGRRWAVKRFAHATGMERLRA